MEKVPFTPMYLILLPAWALGGNSDMAVDSSRTGVQTGEFRSYKLLGQE